MANNETLTVELTSRQQDLLLEGLRYIRSSVKLRRDEPAEEVARIRQEELEELLELKALIEGNTQPELVMHS